MPRTIATVAESARILGISRATAHRYISRHPNLRSKSGKVLVQRLRSAIAADKAYRPRRRASSSHENEWRQFVRRAESTGRCSVTYDEEGLPIAVTIQPDKLSQWCQEMKKQ